MRVDYSDIRILLSKSLVQRYITKRFLSFLEEEGILNLFKALHSFDMDKALEALQQKLGYNPFHRTRKRMIHIIVDFLCECGYLDKKGKYYSWDEKGVLENSVSDDEKEAIKNVFKGQVNFFERCLLHARDFLKGGLPLYDFDSDSLSVWEEFLDDAEFKFARSVLINLLFWNSTKPCHVLAMCHGPGFDLLQIQQYSSDVKITALDFKDIFRQRASNRILYSESIRWIEPELWGGFGSLLPFQDNVFDVVFFACADPYIPEKYREFVYRDIFRTLKSGGSLGMLSHSYPDPEREYVKDGWIRKGIFCHDFCESVCKGWYGFHDAKGNSNLFKSIGYAVNAVTLDGSAWRLDKP
jgi:SAM-dependent methyltransferase